MVHFPMRITAMKSFRCQYVGPAIALLLMFGIQGCQSSRPEAIRPIAEGASSREEGYCLFRPKSDERRRIFSRSVDYLQTDPGWNYEILYGTTSTFGISFEKGDELTFDFDASSQSLRLRHTNENDMEKAVVALHPGPNPAAPLWWRGELRKYPDGRVDEYFVYSLADRDTTSGADVCMRARAVGKTRCQYVHVEYYDHQDLQQDQNKPTVAGVLTPYFEGKCDLPESSVYVHETSEGDGDHGPNRNP
jgi:hypothetical protein